MEDCMHDDDPLLQSCGRDWLLIRAGFCIKESRQPPMICKTWRLLCTDRGRIMLEQFLVQHNAACRHCISCYSQHPALPVHRPKGQSKEGLAWSVVGLLKVQDA